MFTLEDIRDFLKRKFAFDWQYHVWDKKTGERRQVTLEDFDYSGRYSTTDLAFYDKCGNDYIITVYLSDFQFITYKDEPNIMGSGSTTYVHKDLSYQWIDYLLHRHGDEYARKLLNYSQQRRKQLEDELFQKVETYRDKVYNERKKELELYHELSLKAFNYKADSQIDENIETI